MSKLEFEPVLDSPSQERAFVVMSVTMLSRLESKLAHIMNMFHAIVDYMMLCVI